MQFGFQMAHSGEHATKQIVGQINSSFEIFISSVKWTALGQILQT